MKKLPVSPLAPEAFPDIPEIPGFRMAVGETGIKYNNRPDLLFLASDPGTVAAGVLTRSRTRAAPVDWCADALRHGQVAGLVVNAGNANAFTGQAGITAVETTAVTAAALLETSPKEILIASTGVIGVPLPVEKITAVLPNLHAKLGGQGWEQAARAIMTTDTFPKGAWAQTELGGAPVRLAGIAKGSGMIAPDMATMLAFVVTDASISPAILRELVRRTADRSFNCITVDNDTSTSDSFIVMASGRANNLPPQSPDDPALAGFRAALEGLCVDLARQIAGDGEGLQKRITVDVRGAASEAAARRIGLSIAGSPLVKTAVAGEDANWGRIIMAVGKAGEEASRDRLQIWIGGILVAAGGAAAPDYDETAIARHLREREILITVHVGIGTGRARVWGCDLTNGYIAINADYRS